MTSKVKVVEPGSPAYRAIEMVEEAHRLGRLSKTEAAVVWELVWHPLFPAELRAPAARTQMTAEMHDEILADAADHGRA